MSEPQYPTVLESALMLESEALRKDAIRLEWLSDLLKNRPTASFHFNDDPDAEFSDGSLMPRGFTIRYGDPADLDHVTAPTLRECIDQLRKIISLPFQQANPG